MKTKIFPLILGMLCLFSFAFSQSETLTGLNGRIEFRSFANNGLYIRGTLDNFNDQTNQYAASDIDSADVVWDNQGRRYLVHDVISSNLTQAVVDLARIGGGSHIPTGVGMVSRETSNGLALVPPVNSTGISTQLASRVGVHNMKILEGLKTIYTGSDSLKTNVQVKMDENGTQALAIGSWPYFPSRFYDYPREFGLFINKDYGEISITNGGATFSLFNNGGAYISAGLTSNSTDYVYIRASYFTRSAFFEARRNNISSYFRMSADTLGIKLEDYVLGSGNEYRFAPLPSVSRPSSLLNAKSILIHNADGIESIPFYARFQNGVTTSSTDGSGDLSTTVPTMPDATYSVNITVEGTTSYTVSVHTKTTTSFKVRFFNPTTGTAVASTSVSYSYKIEDY